MRRGRDCCTRPRGETVDFPVFGPPDTLHQNLLAVPNSPPNFFSAGFVVLPACRTIDLWPKVCSMWNARAVRQS